MPLRTVIYLRKSTKDKDEKQIHSLPRQQEEMLTLIEKYNYLSESEEHLVFSKERDMVLEDASAKYIGRPKFNEMVQDIRKGKYDVLLCMDLSRLSRNAFDSGVLVQLLEDGCLKMIKTKDHTFRSTPTDKFTLSLFLSVSKFENDQRALNTSSGMKHQKRRGETTHKAPLGYLNAGIKKGQKTVIPDPETWTGVKQLWNLMLTGDWSIADLTKEAERLGVRTERKGKRFPVRDTTLRSNFTNKYYAGFVKLVDKDSGSVEWYAGNHPAMVTGDEFDRVQAILQSRGFKHQKPVYGLAIESLMNEILVCGKCTTEVNGYRKPTKMQFEKKVRYTCGICRYRFSAATNKPCPKCKNKTDETTKSDVHRYYRCGKRHSSLCCAHDFYGIGRTAKNIKAEDIEQFMDSQLSKLYISDALFQVLKRQMYTLWIKKNDLIVEQRKRLQVAQELEEDKRLKLRTKLIGEEHNLSKIEKEDIEHLIDETIREEEELQVKIDTLKEREAEKFEKAWQALQALREAKSIFASEINLEPKRKLILSMVSNLEVKDNIWEIKWKKPFDVVAKCSIDKKGRPLKGLENVISNYDWLPRLDSNQ